MTEQWNPASFTECKMSYDHVTGDNRIVSFWDMLQIDTHALFAALTYVSGCIGEYKALVQLPDGYQVDPSPEQKAQLLTAIKNLELACDHHGFATTGRLAAEAYEQCFDILAPQVPLSRHRMQMMIPLLQGISSTFVAEAQSRKFFAMEASADQYHKSADDLFGAEVVDAFPDAAFDIEEAGKCQAFGLWTASVMHTMRVLEIGLQALADHVGVAHGENWNGTLNQIEKKLREVRKKVDGPEEEQWAAETGTQLRFIKNAWRNHAMHPLATFDEARAKTIFENARLLLIHLAKRGGS